jgi:uncharacterized repeat protein (TIGR03803 family)
MYAGTGKTIHTFSELSRGANPDASLIADSSGNLYGTTYSGGAYNHGEVFELSLNADGTFTQTTLYSFAGAPDGANPAANLTFDPSGNLYGTTASGGTGQASQCPPGCGTVFKLGPKSGGGWSESVLYSFTGSGGSEPFTGVVLDPQGNLYGAAPYTGYYNGWGMIFELSPTGPTWTETTLYTFSGGTDGGAPASTPILDSAGNLYGSVGYVSGNSTGLVYELSPGANGWTEKVLYRFSGGNDGGEPSSMLLMDSNGNLYGTTALGGCQGQGTIFEMSPSAGGSWTERALYCFKYNTGDGADPSGTIAFDAAGNLYGTTQDGGAYFYGTAYQLRRDGSGEWSEHVITSFSDGVDGAYPESGVYVDASGNVYAATPIGASPACKFTGWYDPGCGAVVKLSPRSGGPWQSTVISQFGSTDGAIPLASLIADSFGNYYGTTSAGGAYAYGEVYRLSPSGRSWNKSTLYSFTGVAGDGIYPSGNLVLDKSGNLYGATQFGGATGSAGYCSNGYSGCGVAYELSPSSNGQWKEAILYTFENTTAAQPMAGLISDAAGNLYGTTMQGGTNYVCDDGPYGGCGAVFELSPGAGGSWTETMLHEFAYTDGGNPIAGLTMDAAGNLYGTAINGGSDAGGTAFELSPSSNGAWTFNVIHSFGQVNHDAYYPNSGFVLDSLGNLYGTAAGPTETYGMGVVYELTPAAGSWTTTILHQFNGDPDGSSPYAGVVFDASGKLYGATLDGGQSTNCQFGCGMVFSLSPSGSGWTETQLHSFTGGADGADPASGVILGNGNIFLATSGGGDGQGTIYEIVP